MVEMIIDGVTRSVDAPDEKPLLWALREDLGLTGTKYSCGMGMCGACTVIIKGRATRSCITPIGTVAGLEVQTIENLNDPLGQALKKAWRDERVAECGYCQAGQIMAAHHLLKQRESGADLNLKETLTNICRCGAYSRIHKAIESVAGALDGGE